MQYTATRWSGSVTEHDVAGLVRHEPRQRRKARERCGFCARPLDPGEEFRCPECFEPALCAQHAFECAGCGGHRCRRHIVRAVLPPEGYARAALPRLRSGCRLVRSSNSRRK